MDKEEKMSQLNVLDFCQGTLSLPVFYTKKMVAKTQSFSPSAGKPKAVVEYWKGLNIPICIHEPPPVTRDDFYRAHDKGYVDDVLDLTIVNGFGNRSEMIAESLPYTSGSMLAAAREAILCQSFAIAPCSGFHHAGYGYGGGYCTFNGLMVTALALRADNPKIHVGILDFDQHYGDGTADIINKLCLDWVTHYSASEDFGKPQQAQDFLRKIDVSVSPTSRVQSTDYRHVQSTGSGVQFTKKNIAAT